MDIRYGELRAINDDAKKTRKVQFVISDNTKDRHGTVINTDGWDLENYNKNGIVGYQHEVYGDAWGENSDPDKIIGKGRAFIEDGKLIGQVHFEPADINPLAEKIFQKVLFGTLKATSVGFKKVAGHWGAEDDDEHREGKNPTYYYDKQELLEFSIVNIPSNPNAIKRKSAQEKVNLITFLIREALGDKYDEKLTLKGIINIVGGQSDAIPPDLNYLDELEKYDLITKKHLK